MKQPITLKDFIDQQYELQKRVAEVADKAISTYVNLLPKTPTPAEVLDSAIEVNKIYGKAIQDELVNAAKKFYAFK